MREIKFRGKTGTVKGDIWAYGYLYKVKSLLDDNYQYYIRNEHLQDVIVNEKTIGQFTGIYDKNNVPIYEGDIVKSLINTFKIVYKKGCFFAVGINRRQEYTLFEEINMCEKANIKLEVIGNIYDKETN